MSSTEQLWSWYPVRCCCTPLKIFGFLRLPVKPTQTHMVTDYAGQNHVIELRQISQSQCRIMPAVANVEPRVPDSMNDYRIDVERELAIYSDDRPLQFWRTIPGFVEAEGNRR